MSEENKILELEEAEDPKDADRSPLRFKRWRNPYIDKLPTLPDYILSAYTQTLTPEEKVVLNQRISKFSRLFVELGSGSGHHLVALAESDPKSLFIGFELRFKRVYKTAEKAQQRSLSNLLVIRSDARRLPELIAPGSLDGVYVNFPDPWGKRRWEKHRLLSREYLQVVGTLLRQGGFLSYKTDHLQRFNETAKLLREMDHLIVQKCTEDLHHSLFCENNIVTEFEGLFLSQKLPISYLQAVKK